MKNLLLKSSILLLLLPMLCAGQSKRHKHLHDQECHFGANLQGLNYTNETAAGKNLLKVKYLRDNVILTGSGGYTNGTVEKGIQYKSNAGIRNIVNINWSGGGSSGGLKNHPKDMVAYRAKLVNFMQNNAKYIYVAVIENEPYNGHYFNYQGSQGATIPYTVVADYVEELRVATQVCHQFGVMVSDGASHVAYYGDIMNGFPMDDAAARANEAFDGYATIPLDFVNYHFNVPFGTLSNQSLLSPSDVLRSKLDYLRLRTKCPHVITNEWHQEEDGTTLTQQKALCKDIVRGIRESHTLIGILFSGDGHSGALTFVDATTNQLTELGIAFRDAIAVPSQPQP